ncbi:MAG: hypothetical protein AB1Z23_02695 [Eubacteriales bacterium]
MQYSNLIGCTLQYAKNFAEENNIKALFIETKDRYNDYENKRIIRVKKIDGDETIEFLYAGFPPYKE